MNPIVEGGAILLTMKPEPPGDPSRRDLLLLAPLGLPL